MVPQTTDPYAPATTEMYISSVYFPPFENLDTAIRKAANLWNYEPGLIDRSIPVSCTIGTRTETPSIWPNQAGHINGWVSADTGAANYSIDWVNRYGITGRGLGGSSFIARGTEGNWNPTWGGNYYEGPPIGETQAYQIPSDPYDVYDVIHGAPQREPYQITDLGGGSKQIVVHSYPYDFNFDGLKPVPNPLDKGGLCFDPILYPEMPLTRTWIINWNGNNGIHVYEEEMYWAHDIPTDYSVFYETCQMGINWIMDEAYIYDKDVNGLTRTDNYKIWNAMAAPTLTSVTGSGDVVTVTFQSAHGITVGTKLIVNMTSWTGTPSINGEHEATFINTTQCTFATTGAAASYTGGQLDSYDIYYTDLTDLHKSVSFSDDVTIDTTSTFTFDNQKSTNVDKSLLSGGRGAGIWRVTNPGVRAWSAGKDFAVGMYFHSVASIGQTADRRRLDMICFRQAADRTDPGGPLDQENAIMQAPQAWLTNRTSPMPKGTRRRRVFILTGTWAQVQGHLSTMDALTDAQCGWPNDEPS